MGESDEHHDGQDDDEAQGQEVSDHCAECARPAVVAVNGRWLCLLHYHQRIQELGETLRTLRRGDQDG